jgi:hypothetical protein
LTDPLHDAHLAKSYTVSYRLSVALVGAPCTQVWVVRGHELEKVAPSEAGQFFDSGE